MAGSKLERLVTQAQVWWTITMPKPLQTKGGKIGFFVGILIVFALFVGAVVFQGDESGSGSDDFSSSSSSSFSDNDSDGNDAEESSSSFTDNDSSSSSDSSSNSFAFDDSAFAGGGGGNNEDGDSSSDDEGSSGSSTFQESDGESSSAIGNLLQSEERQNQINEWKTIQAQLFKEKDKQFMKFFDKHRKESEIYAHFAALSNTYKHLGGMIKSKVIGTSYEKRNIRAYMIGNGATKRGVLVVGLEHSGEWSVPMALTYFATRLIQKYAVNPAVTEVLEALNIYIVPVANPDGFMYSQSSKSYNSWQKNRALSTSGLKGFDINRDFSTFSQYESKAIRDFANSKKNSIHAFVSVHCCAGTVIAPANLSCLNPRTIQEQRKVGQQIAFAMGKGGNYQYPFMVQKSEPNAVKGYSVNWALEDLGIKLSFTMEGRGFGSNAKNSLVIPTSNIVEHSQNITMGLMELSRYVVNEYHRTEDRCSGNRKKYASNDDDGDAAAGDDNSESNDDENSSIGGGDDSSSSENGNGDENENFDENNDSSSSSDGGDDGFSHGQEDESEGEETFQKVAEDQHSSHADADESSLEVSIQYATSSSGGKQLPRVGSNHFLFFAYGPEMYFDVLLKAGISSARKFSNGILEGFTIDFTYHSGKKWKSGVADIVRSPHSHVYGVLWLIHKSQLELLTSWMQATTRLSPMQPREVKVQDRMGNVNLATTFTVRVKSAGSDILGKYRRFSPSRQYRNCMIKGAKQQHLSLDWIDKKLRLFSPLYSDRTGSTGHRNSAIGDVCDPK